MQQAAMCIRDSSNGSNGHAGTTRQRGSKTSSSTAVVRAGGCTTGDLEPVKTTAKAVAAGVVTTSNGVKEEGLDGSTADADTPAKRHAQKLWQRLARTTSVRRSTYNYVLGISSLWLLWPVTHGLQAAIHGRDTSPLSLLLILSSIATVIVSTLMWRRKQPGSLLFKADIVLASFTMFLLLCKSTFGTGRPTSSIGKLVFPSLVILTWTSVCTATWNKLHLLAFISHNVFRFVGCWWVYYSLEVFERCFPVTFALFTTTYLIHTGSSVAIAQRIPMCDDVCKTRYDRGCVELVAYIVAVMAVHFSYNCAGGSGIGAQSVQ